MNVSIARIFRLESARSLPRLPATHPCSRCTATRSRSRSLEGPVDPQLAWLVDYDDIARAWQPIAAALDHRHLNDVPGLDNPTSEHVAHWIFTHLAPALPALVAISVMETPETRATYRAEARRDQPDRAHLRLSPTAVVQPAAAGPADRQRPGLQTVFQLWLGAPPDLRRWLREELHGPQLQGRGRRRRRHHRRRPGARLHPVQADQQVRSATASITARSCRARTHASR